jgi:CheY-like chemotaxis protein
MPHGHCYLWQPAILWTQVITNIAIGLAYMSITITLYYLVRKSREVLLVEDDDDIRTDLAELLRLKGYSVQTAANGAEALDRLRDPELPCLILLDLMMPVMDGWQFREAQLQDDTLAEVPVVVITGIAEDTAALQAKKVLRKPVRLDDLVSTIRGYCAAASDS